MFQSPIKNSSYNKRKEKRKKYRFKRISGNMKRHLLQGNWDQVLWQEFMSCTFFLKAK